MFLLDEPRFHPATVEQMLGAIQEAEATPPPLNIQPPKPRPRQEPDWSSPAIQNCLPQGWRPEPPRIPQPRAGPHQAA